jgi:hypothetical protein
MDKKIVMRMHRERVERAQDRFHRTVSARLDLTKHLEASVLFAIILAAGAVIQPALAPLAFVFAVIVVAAVAQMKLAKEETPLVKRSIPVPSPRVKLEPTKIKSLPVVISPAEQLHEEVGETMTFLEFPLRRPSL